MAQIQVTGCVLNDLVPKTGQSGRPYVNFSLLETTGYGKSRWTQIYQVWAWGKEEVDRLMKLGVEKNCMIWLTGSFRLVDAYTQENGRTKQLKVAYKDCRLLSSPKETQQTHNPAAPFSGKELDGDREPLPE